MEVTQNLVILLVNGLRNRLWERVNTLITKCGDMVVNA